MFINLLFLVGCSNSDKNISVKELNATGENINSDNDIHSENTKQMKDSQNEMLTIEELENEFNLGLQFIDEENYEEAARKFEIVHEYYPDDELINSYIAQLTHFNNALEAFKNDDIDTAYLDFLSVTGYANEESKLVEEAYEYIELLLPEMTEFLPHITDEEITLDEFKKNTTDDLLLEWKDIIENAYGESIENIPDDDILNYFSKGFYPKTMEQYRKEFETIQSLVGFWASSNTTAPPGHKDYFDIRVSQFLVISPKNLFYQLAGGRADYIIESVSNGAGSTVIINLKNAGKNKSSLSEAINLRLYEGFSPNGTDEIEVEHIVRDGNYKSVTVTIYERITPEIYNSIYSESDFDVWYQNQYDLDGFW